MAMFREDRVARYAFLAGAAAGAGAGAAAAGLSTAGQLGVLAGASIAAGGGQGKSQNASSLLTPDPGQPGASVQSRAGQLARDVFQPDIQQAISGSGEPRLEQQIRQWNVEVGRASEALEGIRRAPELGQVGEIARERDAARPTRLEQPSTQPNGFPSQLSRDPAIADPITAFSRQPAETAFKGLVERVSAGVEDQATSGFPPAEEPKSPGLFDRLFSGAKDIDAVSRGQQPPSIKEGAQLSGFQRHLLRASDIAAALQGQVPPSIKIALQAQKEDRLASVAARKDLQAGHTALQAVAQESSKLPVGPQRDEYFNTVRPMMEAALGPEFLLMLDYMQENPGYLGTESFEQLMERNPELEAIQGLGGAKALVAYISSPSVMEEQLKADQRALQPAIRRKLEGAIPWVEKNLPDDWRRINKDGIVAAGEAAELRDKLPERWRTTDAEHAAFLADSEPFNDLVATPGLIKSKRVAELKGGKDALTNEQLAKNEAIEAARTMLGNLGEERRKDLLEFGSLPDDSLAAKILMKAATPKFGEKAEDAVARLEALGFTKKNAEVIADEAGKGEGSLKRVVEFMRAAKKRIGAFARKEAADIQAKIKEGGTAIGEAGASAAGGLPGLLDEAARAAPTPPNTTSPDLSSLEPFTRTAPPAFPKDPAARQEGATYSLGNGTIVRYNGPGKPMTRLMAP